MRMVERQQVGAKTYGPCPTERAVKEMTHRAHSSVIDVEYNG